MELLSEQNNGKIIILYKNNVIAVDDSEYSNENGVWKKLTKSQIQTKQLTIQKEIRTQEILQELDILDRKRIRAIAEPTMKDENITWLEYYNNEISALREELASIS